MNWKIVTSILVTGLLTFLLGWFFHDMKQFADGVVADGKRVDSLQKANHKFATIMEISLKQTPQDRFKQTPHFQLPFLV